MKNEGLPQEIMPLTVTDLKLTPQQCFHWIRWADADYLSARLLLKSSLLIQGTAFANTAIEKYLKCILLYMRLPVPNTHSVTSLYKKVKKEDSSNLYLNEDFLAFLDKAYALRYPDNLPEGFNIAFNHAKILAELDGSVQEITKRFQVTREDKIIAMVLEEGRYRKNKLIVARNTAINPRERSRLFRERSHSFDLRVSKGKLYTIPYATVRIKDDGVFNLRALTEVGDGKFKLAFAKRAIALTDSEFLQVKPLS